MDLVGNEIPVEEGEYGDVAMDHYNWQMTISFYDAVGESDDTIMSTPELAENSGIELYRVDLYLDWETGRRQRELHFSTIRSVLANR